MSFLANVLWLLLGGWLIGLVYLIGAVIFFPLLPFLWQFVTYSFWPFGKAPVKRSDLARYREQTGSTVQETGLQTAGRGVRFLANVVWVLTFGWFLALLHLIAAFLNILVFWLIITIPNIAGHFRLMGVAFRPFGRIIVPKALAEEISVGAAKNKLGL